MKYAIILLLGAVLNGCGYISDDRSGSDVSCSPECVWNGNYQERDSEFFIDYSPQNSRRPMMPSVQQWWAYVKACTGFDVSISHAPLAIEYVDSSGIDGSASIGRIWWGQAYTKIILADVYTGRTTRHEMIHYLLYHIGLDDNDNINHNSTYFHSCDVQQV